MHCIICSAYNISSYHPYPCLRGDTSILKMIINAGVSGISAGSPKCFQYLKLLKIASSLFFRFAELETCFLEQLLPVGSNNVTELTSNQTNLTNVTTNQTANLTSLMVMVHIIFLHPYPCLRGAYKPNLLVSWWGPAISRHLRKPHFLSVWPINVDFLHFLHFILYFRSETLTSTTQQKWLSCH